MKCGLLFVAIVALLCVASGIAKKKASKPKSDDHTKHESQSQQAVQAVANQMAGVMVVASQELMKANHDAIKSHKILERKVRSDGSESEITCRSKRCTSKCGGGHCGRCGRHKCHTSQCRIAECKCKCRGNCRDLCKDKCDKDICISKCQSTCPCRCRQPYCLSECEGKCEASNNNRCRIVSECRHGCRHRCGHGCGRKCRHKKICKPRVDCKTICRAQCSCGHHLQVNHLNL